MPPLSFLKSDKDKPPITSNATPESPSKYRPSRLLRRKPSTKVKKTWDDDSGPSEPLTASSTASTFAEQQQIVLDDPITASEFFATPRRGSESLSKRSGGWYGREEETVVVNAESSSSRRIADQQALVDTDLSHNRPLTPPEPKSLYPTALSPPRRTILRSPQPAFRPPSPDQAQPMLQTLSANGLGPRADSPSWSSDGHLGNLTPSPIKPVSAAWLARKPSTSRLTRKTSLGRADIVPIRRRSEDTSRSRASSSSNAESLESGAEESVQRRKSKGRRREENGGFEVEVVCVDSREEGTGVDEMRWEVVIRRQGPGGVISPTSPQQLSTLPSTSRAPATASSINLSLSLDQPTGKLVFISFPTDLQATPTKRRPSASTPRTNFPSTPPMNGSPSTPSRRKTAYPSPGGYKVSPPASPRDMFTPRRTRLVTAAQLDGGLYPAKPVTEELQTSFVDLDSESDGGLEETMRPMKL